ncbi:MAG TPA: hypothetical protein VK445_02710 [Dissulfurispiraceae bacterium]|nr:hypothetical protein [Dissulfurispiraceae bacterium]
MEGGILAYQGAKTSGSPVSAMFCVPSHLPLADLLGMALIVNKGTARFLDRLAAVSPGIDLADILPVQDEAERITELYVRTIGEIPADFPQCVLGMPCDDLMAGCVRISDSLQWAQGKGIFEVLEFLLSIWMVTYDHYLRLAHHVSGGAAQEVFAALALEARRHGEAVAKSLDRAL